MCLIQFIVVHVYCCTWWSKSVQHMLLVLVLRVRCGRGHDTRWHYHLGYSRSTRCIRLWLRTRWHYRLGRSRSTRCIRLWLRTRWLIHSWHSRGLLSIGEITCRQWCIRLKVKQETIFNMELTVFLFFFLKMSPPRYIVEPLIFIRWRSRSNLPAFRFSNYVLSF